MTSFLTFSVNGLLSLYDSSNNCTNDIGPTRMVRIGGTGHRV
jgi:hypothetical protein